MKSEVEKKGLYGLILAGGAGTRFWPLSRELTPKQLLKLFGTQSLIHQTISRILPLVSQENIFIVSNKRLAEEIKNDLLSQKPVFNKVKYLNEPLSRNTAPAIGLAAVRLSQIDPEGIMLVLPSDHVIRDGDYYRSILKSAASFALDGHLVTLGLKPQRPDTAFGYIHAGSSIGKRDGIEAFLADKFTEKPDFHKAKAYLAEGGYYWNSGMFVFKVDVILQEIKRLMSGLYDCLMKFNEMPVEIWSDEDAVAIFSDMESISIDYGVLEQTDKVVVVPIDIKWSDVGSLTAIEQFYPKDEKDNVMVGNVVDIDSEGSIIYSDKRLLATLGLKDTVVIDTHDATLVCPKKRSQDVRKIVNILKEAHAEEYLTHRTAIRPWGYYTVLEKGAGFKIKLIEIRQGEKLSHQLHHHRSEHWIVLSGTARVTRDGETYNVHTGESTFIPASTPHRLENPGKVPLKIIEVQNGEYLEEDDIVRMDDQYERE